jgi:hypothetical protein
LFEGIRVKIPCDKYNIFMKHFFFSLSLFLFVGAGFFLLSAESVQAATYTWNSPGVSNIWSLSTNWSPNGNPGSGDDVIFDGTSTYDCTADVTVDVNSLSISPGYSGNFIQEQNMTIGTGGFSFSDGVFSGSGAHQIDLNGAFAIVGGTFIAPGTFYVSGTWTHTTGGSYTAGSNLVVADGTGVATGYDFNNGLSGSGEFYRFYVSMTAGDVTISSSDTLVVNDRLRLFDGQLNSTTNVNILGDLQLRTGWNGGNAQITFSGPGTSTIEAEAGAEAVFDNDVMMSKDPSAKVKLISDLDFDGSDQDITVSAGTFELNGYDLTVDDVAGEIAVNTDATLKLAGTETVTVSANPSVQSGANIAYTSSSSNVTINDWNYENLIIGGGSAVIFSLGATETVSGNLTVDSGKFNLSGYDLTVTGTVSNNDTIQLQGAETVSLTNDDDTGTVEFLGDGDAVADTYTITDFSTVFNSLTINSADGNTDIFELGAAVDINGTLTTNAGSFDVTVGNHQINLAANWAHNAGGVILNMRAGTIVLDTASTANITGGQSFFHLTSATAGKTINFYESQTVTVAGDLTLTGASGNEITLASMSPGTQWGLSVAGTSTVSYVNVTDSDASGSASAITPTSSTDGGNNTNWTFPSTSGGENIVITETYTITLLTPNGDAIVPLGESYAITWESTENIDTVSIYYSANNGSNYQTVIMGEGNDGEYTWSVPESAITTGLIKIDGLSSGQIKSQDTSDRTFTIALVAASEEEAEEEVEEVVEEETTTESTGTMGVNPFTGEEEEISETEDGMYIRAEGQSTVYFLEEGVRRPFMNEATYFTYEDSYDTVEVVTGATLQEHLIGSAMLPKAGVVLVKVQTDPKVYWIDAEATLRWIATEELAIELFGDDWADYVVDVESTFMTRFDAGDDVEDAEDIEIDLDLMIKREALHE